MNLLLDHYDLEEIESKRAVLVFESNKFSVREDDFCLHKNAFIHDRLLIPIFIDFDSIASDEKFNCAVLFVSLFVRSFDKYRYGIKDSAIFECIYDPDFYFLVRNCNFDKRL